MSASCSIGWQCLLAFIYLGSITKVEIAEINKEELLADFVEKLPTIRRKLNISQGRLGEMLGLSRQSISSIERGSVQL